MIGILVARLHAMRARFPRLFEWARRLGVRHFARPLGIFPRPLGHEMRAVSEVLHSARWNMAYGKGLTHERLEADFADYIGVPYAVAVNTGGMALQMSMRALGLKPGREVLLQADTCSATGFAVMNAGCTPLFADIAPQSFMLDRAALDRLDAPSVGALIATHMWGNPEDMAMVEDFAVRRGIPVIEDACLALGATSRGRMAGAAGKVGVFSFGCLKPIQGGEGGMIVTSDETLARELRAMRHWGDRSLDFGERDTTQLSWNGRMSEIVAAVVREQLRGYPAYLRDLREAVADFACSLEKYPGLSLVLGSASSIQDCAFSQVVLKLDAATAGRSKEQLRAALAEQGIITWHANFEPIPSLSFFRSGAWRDWIIAGDKERAAANYHGALPSCETVYRQTGIGIVRPHFQSAMQLKTLKRKLDICLRNAP